METVSTLWFSAAAVLSLVPSRIGYGLHDRHPHWSTSNEVKLTLLRIIDVPRRAWTNPLSIFLRVKGFNATPYCPPRSSKELRTVIGLCVSFVSSVSSRFVKEVPAVKSFPTDETLLPNGVGYDITPSDTVLQNTSLALIMESQLSVDRSILPLLGNQFSLSDYFIPNVGILQASSYPPPEYYSGGGADPPERPRGSGKGKGKGRESSWQDDEQEYRESSAGGSAGGNNEDSGPSKRKTSKKTPMACYYCRGRKLKCDGVRPTCHNCAEKAMTCRYDAQIRRRGPGKKNRLNQQQPSTGEQSAETAGQQSSLPSSSFRTAAGSYNTPIAPLPSPPMPQYPYELGVPPSGLESRIISSRLASESRYAGSEQTTERYAEERYGEDYPPPRAYTQQQRPPSSSYYPQQSSSMSYPGYQQSSYRDQPPPLPPPPHSSQQGYHPGGSGQRQQYYRQDYPSTSSYTAEYSSRRHSYAEEEEEYASEDDNTTSSRRDPSPGYEGDPRQRGPDTSRQR